MQQQEEPVNADPASTSRVPYTQQQQALGRQQQGALGRQQPQNLLENTQTRGCMPLGAPWSTTMPRISPGPNRSANPCSNTTSPVTLETACHTQWERGLCSSATFERPNENTCTFTCPLRCSSSTSREAYNPLRATPPSPSLARLPQPCVCEVPAHEPHVAVLGRYYTAR